MKKCRCLLELTAPDACVKCEYKEFNVIQNTIGYHINVSLIPDDLDIWDIPFEELIDKYAISWSPVTIKYIYKPSRVDAPIGIIDIDRYLDSDYY